MNQGDKLLLFGFIGVLVLGFFVVRYDVADRRAARGTCAAALAAARTPVDSLAVRLQTSAYRGRDGYRLCAQVLP